MKDKQIDEMAKVIAKEDDTCRAKTIAEALYNAGYRMASEVALEVIEAVEKIVDKYYNRHIFGVEDLSDVEQEAVMNFSDDITSDLAELKKKYIGEGANVLTNTEGGK